jgi:hypothetical protein
LDFSEFTFFFSELKERERREIKRPVRPSRVSEKNFFPFCSIFNDLLIGFMKESLDEKNAWNCAEKNLEIFL